MTAVLQKEQISRKSSQEFNEHILYKTTYILLPLENWVRSHCTNYKELEYQNILIVLWQVRDFINIFPSQWIKMSGKGSEAK